MKQISYFLAIVFLAIILISPVLADMNSTIKLTESDIEVLKNQVAPEPIKQDLTPEYTLSDTTYTSLDTSIIKIILDNMIKIIIPVDETKLTVDSLIEATPESVLSKPQIVVDVDGDKVALIPETSVFANKEIHQFCYRYGYGSDEWYKCEESLA